MKYINWLINDSSFLGLYGGFWFVTLPIIIFIIFSEYYNLKKKRKESNDDMPTESIIINLSKEEKWMLNKLIKVSGSNLDKYIRDSIKSL